MPNTKLLWVAGALSVAYGCSSDSEVSPTAAHQAAAGGDAKIASAGGTAAPASGLATSASAFDAPPPSPGYTRLEVPVVKDLSPGADITYCQYIQAPLDRDLDVLDVQGHQSSGGHHAVAYASIATVAFGTSRVCNSEDNMGQAGFVGGIGGEGGVA